MAVLTWARFGEEPDESEILHVTEFATGAACFPGIRALNDDVVHIHAAYQPPELLSARLLS